VNEADDFALIVLFSVAFVFVRGMNPADCGFVPELLEAIGAVLPDVLGLVFSSEGLFEAPFCVPACTAEVFPPANSGDSLVELELAGIKVEPSP